MSARSLRRLLSENIAELAGQVNLTWKSKTRGALERELMGTAELAWRSARETDGAVRTATEPLAAPPTPGEEQPSARHRHPAPEALPFGVSHCGAEHLVAQWMLHLGEKSARVTPASGDGGVDVECRLPNGHAVIVQVKNLASVVPIAQVRELAGVAAHRRCHAAMFTSWTYPDSAVKVADDLDIALFRYDAEGGSCEASNQVAARVVRADGYDCWTPGEGIV